MNDDLKAAAEALGAKVIGLIVSHRSKAGVERTLHLSGRGRYWSAITFTDSDDTEPSDVEGLGETPMAAIENACDEADLVEEVG